MINFRKRSLNQQKSQFEKFQKYPWNSCKNAWKLELKCKRKGKIDLLPWREENLAKNPKENDKKLVGELCPIWRERKFWKELLKSKSEQESAF